MMEGGMKYAIMKPGLSGSKTSVDVLDGAIVSITILASNVLGDPDTYYKIERGDEWCGAKHLPSEKRAGHYIFPQIMPRYATLYDDRSSAESMLFALQKEYSLDMVVVELSDAVVAA